MPDNQLAPLRDPGDKTTCRDYGTLITAAIVNKIKQLGKGPTMKKAITTILVLLLAAAGTVLAQSPAPVKGYADMSQPIAGTYPTTAINTYKLAPGQACTTKAYFVAGMGTFSLQVWDSVKYYATNCDTVILNIRFRCSNLDSVPGQARKTLFNMSHWTYGSTLLTDSIVVAADTLIAGEAAATKKKTFGVDFSDKVPHCAFIDYICKNTGPDTIQALRLFPCHSVQF